MAWVAILLPPPPPTQGILVFFLILRNYMTSVLFSCCYFFLSMQPFFFVLTQPSWDGHFQLFSSKSSIRGTAMLVLLTLPFYLLSHLPQPSPPSQSKLQYIKTVCGYGGWGVLSCVVDHILQEFNNMFLTRFRTYKIATPPQTKTPVQTTFRD